LAAWAAAVCVRALKRVDLPTLGRPTIATFSAMARGIFAYGHDLYHDAAKGSGTYTRRAAPRQPVTLDDVHPSIRDDLAALRLPVRFAEAPVVELADHMGEDAVQTYGTPLDPANAPPPPPPRAPAAPKAGAVLAVTVVTIVAIAILLLLRRG
jgi:hypothetical protein